MDILPIQGSTVLCKHVFSSAKETTTTRCNRISHELMEALQMLKFSGKKGRGLNFTVGTAKDVELSELEGFGTDEGLVPADMMAFIANLNVCEDFE